MPNACCREATFSLEGISFSLEFRESAFPLTPVNEVVQNNIWALATSPSGYCKNLSRLKPGHVQGLLGVVLCLAC